MSFQMQHQTGVGGWVGFKVDAEAAAAEVASNAEAEAKEKADAAAAAEVASKAAAEVKMLSILCLSCNT
jgi:predicted 2-oxoglutarate/Fe(II)-dependent dioxygenase YbiX